jgi:hypothetical protein
VARNLLFWRPNLASPPFVRQEPGSSPITTLHHPRSRLHRRTVVASPVCLDTLPCPRTQLKLAVSLDLRMHNMPANLIDHTRSAYPYPLLIKQLLHTPLAVVPEQEIKRSGAESMSSSAMACPKPARSWPLRRLRRHWNVTPNANWICGRGPDFRYLWSTCVWRRPDGIRNSPPWRPRYRRDTERQRRNQALRVHDLQGALAFAGLCDLPFKVLQNKAGHHTVR